MQAGRYLSAFLGSNDFGNVKTLIESKDKRTKIGALCRMTDQKVLMGIALIESDPDLRGPAVLKVNNQALLKNIALRDPSWEVRSDALQVIRDYDFLMSVSMQDEHPFVRAFAKECALNMLRTD